jgi:hypothetical protein
LYNTWIESYTDETFIKSTLILTQKISSEYLHLKLIDMLEISVNFELEILDYYYKFYSNQVK